MLLHTNRLYLRPLSPFDAPAFRNLNADPEVLRYTGDLPFADLRAAENFLSDYDQYRLYGVGRLAVIDKEGEAFLGWCGLKYTAARAEYDLGFRFFKKYWNQGYATEAARAVLHWGFTDKNLSEIIGRAAVANPASLRVLEKIGMTRRRTIDFAGMPGVLYSIVNPQK